MRSSVTQPSSIRSATQLAHPLRLLAGAAGPREPRLELDPLRQRPRRRRRRARPPRKLPPLATREAAHVRRVAQPLRLLERVAAEGVVGDDHRAGRDARHLRAPPRATSPKWCAASRETTRSKLPSANGSSSAGRRRRAACPARDPWSRPRAPPRAAAARRARRRLRRRAPSLAPAAHSTIRSRSAPSRCASAVAVGLRALRPEVGHCASSTARRAASSIVGSTWRFGGARLGEQPAPLLRVRAVEPDDDRMLDRHLRRAPAGCRARPRRSA